ncbi:MAG: glycosyltransferase [Coriobacteriia bacterium]|nr:glycosyltransferase [Coriobacteriia bacterium]
MRERLPQQPTLFLVTACLNAEATISDTFAVLEEQAVEWAHYFVIDGASTDGTVELAHRFAEEQGGRVTVISEPDTGIYSAMNKGVRLALRRAADDDLIAIINADDYYVSGALHTVRAAAARHPEVDIFYGDCELLDECGVSRRQRRTSEPRLPVTPTCFTMPLEHPTMFMRAHVYNTFGLYDESYRIAADYEFVLRLIVAQTSTLYLAEPITYFREGGISTTKINESLREAIRARIAHGANPVYEWARYAKQKFNEQLFAVLRVVPGVECIYTERYR